jgi:anti-anti-sigma factor
MTSARFAMTLPLDSGTPPPNRVELSSAARDVAAVALVGEHDLDGYENLRTVFARAAIRAPNVLIDLSACEFIDSTVISMVLHTETIVTRDGGTLVVALPAERNSVSRLAEVIKLGQLVPTFASVAAALASFDPSYAEATPP